MEIADRLEEAAGTGEVVTIAYAGGSQPYTRREIIVRKANAEHIYAVCMVADDFRTFRVDRVLAVDSAADAYPPYDPSLPAAVPVKAPPRQAPSPYRAAQAPSVRRKPLPDTEASSRVVWWIAGAAVFWALVATVVALTYAFTPVSPS